jgi:hypothetical protein
VGPARAGPGQSWLASRAAFDTDADWKNWAARGAVTDVIRFPESTFWLAGELFGWVELSINENKIQVKKRQIFHFLSSVVATTELAAYLFSAGDTRCISRVVKTVKFSSMITHRIIDQSTVQHWNYCQLIDVHSGQTPVIENWRGAI